MARGVILLLDLGIEASHGRTVDEEVYWDAIELLGQVIQGFLRGAVDGVCGDFGGSFVSLDVLRPGHVKCVDCVGAVFGVVLEEHVSNAASGTGDQDDGHGGVVCGEGFRGLCCEKMLSEDDEVLVEVDL